MSNATPELSPDRALEDPRDDRLGYAPFAKALSTSVLQGCPADGLVVALYGAWGSGKTTALRFIAHYLQQAEDPPVIMWFTPWWFAGHEDLVRRFFHQFEAALLKKRAAKRKLISRLSAFTAILAEAPVVAPVGKAAKAALNALERVDIVDLKKQIVDALAAEASRVVVIVDDIDRLTAEDTRQLFKLIKAVADFPNVIYLLAFDRDVVAKAMEQTHQGAGAEYLEKIVQVPFVLPDVDRGMLHTMLFERLDRILEGTPDGLFDQAHWVNVFREGIAPFIDKPRDVARLANTLAVTYPAVCGEVNPVDFVAVETLRVFCPAAYDTIRTNPDRFIGYTPTAIWGSDPRTQERKFHDAWLAKLGARSEVVRRMAHRLFPVLTGTARVGAAWRSALRICSPEIFPIYFRLAISAGEVSALEVRELLSLATDSASFGERIVVLAGQKRPDGHTRASSMLRRLTDRAKDFPADAIPHVIAALFMVGDRVMLADPVVRFGLDFGDDLHMLWLLHELLRRTPATDRRAVLGEAIRRGDALTLMTQVVLHYGHANGLWEGTPRSLEDRLLTDDDIAVLAAALQARIEAAAVSGSLWQAARPVPLLQVWTLWGDIAAARTAVDEYVRDDKNLLAIVGGFAGHMSARGMTKMTIDPLRLWGFFDTDALCTRFASFKGNSGLTESEQAVVRAFASGKAAREKGWDPHSPAMFDEVEE